MLWPRVVTVGLMGSCQNRDIFWVVESTGHTNGMNVIYKGEKSQ